MFYKAKYMRQPAVRLWKRLTALTLCTCMVLTMSPPMTAAAEASVVDSGEVTLLSGFAPLPDEVAVQNVPLGVSSVDLVLPDMLEAYLAEPNFGDTEDLPPAPSKPEDSESGVVDSGTPPDSSSSEASSTPAESSSAPESTPTESSSAPESTPDAPPSESSEPTVGEPADEETATTPDEPAADEQAPDVDEPATEDAATQVLSAYVKSDITEADELATPAETITVSGVTWASEPAFDGNTAGTYKFTAVLSDGYTVEDGAALPTITVMVGHILEQGDCMNYTCATHYPPEVLAKLSENEDPVPLTLTDLVEDYGVETPPARRTRAAPNPQTLVVTNDNENNAHTGTTDGDIDAGMTSSMQKQPIEISFDIPANKMPTQSAYIAIKAYDVDEDDGEKDYVYLNDDIYLPKTERDSYNQFFNSSTIGYLSGTNGTWNTTVLEVPLEKLKPGKNVVSTTVAPYWIVQIDWMQLILDGGEKDANIDSFSLTLGDPVNSSGAVQVPATVTINQKGSTEYVTEYSLIQIATGNALDAKFGKAQTQETVSLSMPLNAQTGTYKIIGILKDPATEAIKALDEVEFPFTQNVGAVVIPKMAHTLTPSGLTNQSVAIAVSVADANGCTEITIQDGGARTVTANGDYAFTVSFKYNGGDKSFAYTVPVTNIDKTPPVIAYTAFSVLEGTSNTEVDNLLKAALTATDDRQLAGAPTYTLPANIAATAGTKNITVTATDAVGNTASQSCVITVTPLPLSLVQNEPARVGVTNSFTLSAKLTNIGGDLITETGFVWGIMQIPTTAINNDMAKTTSAVTAKGDTVTITAAGIADGVNYYARPYAISGGKTYYGDQKPFVLNSKNYGTFAVTNNGNNTFTITRTGGSDDAQTVYYRTVNGSAVGGTHFTHVASTVTFAASETSKTVSITEHGVNAVYGGKPATAYSNASRTYQLEIYKVEGGGGITGGVSRATRTMTGNTTIDRSIYTKEKFNMRPAPSAPAWWVHDHSGGSAGDLYFVHNRSGAQADFTNWNASASISDGRYTSDQANYLNATSLNYLYRYALNAYETKDGWEHAWIGNHVPNNVNPKAKASGSYTDKAIALDDSAIGTGLWSGVFQVPQNGSTNFEFPQTATGGGEGSGITKAYNGSTTVVGSNQYVKFGINDTAYSYFAATGTTNNHWQVHGFTDYILPYDTVEPQLVGVAPMAGGTYKPGDQITVALVFDEIVDFTNSYLGIVSLNTSYGTMSYAGGDNTNVLYFTGTVPEGASGTVTVNSINNAADIKDMCDQTGTNSGGSGSGSITVDSTKPTVLIDDSKGITNGTAKGKIIAANHSSLKYTWSQSSTPPVSGWLTCTSGYTAQTRQTTGTWFLHAIAERNSNGTSSYTNTSFNFTNPTSPLPTLAVSADNTNWAQSRNITVARTPAAASVTYAGPQSGTATGGTVNVTTNGLYTFTLTSGDETITEMVSVSRLDAVAPTLTLREPGGAGAVYNTLTFAADAADNLSGIAKVEYAVTGTNVAPSSGWQALSNSGGSYNGSYTETAATTKTTKYIHVRATDAAGNVTTKTSAAYTVVKENAAAAPVITLIGKPTSWTKGPVNLTWTVTNQGAGGITVYLNGATSNATSGTLAATGNGLYSVSITDQNGVSANASLLVDKIDAEAPILTALTASKDWSSTVTLTGVTDNRTPLPDASGTTTGYGGSGLKTQEWKLGNGAYTAFTGSSFSVNATGTYTVRLTDNAGNTNEYETLVSQVDATAPSVTVGIPDAGWTSAAQNIAVTYTDSQSGISTAQYAITTTNSGTKPTTLTNLPASGGTVSVSTNGTSYIYYKVTDNAGNVKDGYSNPIKVDTTTPTLTLSGGKTGVLATANLQIDVARSFGLSGGKVEIYKDSSLVKTLGDSESFFNISSSEGHFKVTATSNAGKSVSEELDVYVITMDANGGSGSKNQKVVGGGTVAEPTASKPTRTGYTLTGWQKDGTAYDFTTPVNGNITLIAVWTLNAPTVSLAVDKATATYNAGNTVATLTATPGHTADGVTYTYEWYRGSTKLSGTGSTMPLTDAAHSGSYTVKVTASAGGLTSAVTSSAVTVTINKADVQIDTAPTASGITYGQALSNSTLTGGAATQKDSSLLRLFRSGTAVPGTFAWTTHAANPAVADSGSTEYGITFTPTDTTNYNTATTTQKLTVSKATLTPSVASAVSREYNGGTDATGTLALSGAVLGQAPTASGTFTFTSAGVGTNKPVDVTGIALGDTWGDNYVLSAMSLSNAATTAEITPKTIGLTWSGYTGLVYTGSPVNVTVTATGLVAPDSCTVTVTGGTQSNAGIYTATAATLDNANYRLPSANTQSYTIAKAPVTFAVTNDTYIYDASAKAATVAQTGGETPDISGKFTVHYEQSGSTVASPTNKGQYDTIVTITNANFKHSGQADGVTAFKVGTLTIDGTPYPDADTMTWPTAAGIAYGQTLSDSTLIGGDQTANGTYTWTTPDTVPTVQNEGYWVVFNPTDTNYAPVEKVIDITVAKATPTLTLPTAAGITYGETLADSTLSGGSASTTYNGTANTDVPGQYKWTTPATKPTVVDSNSTDYGLTFTPDDTDNYKIVTSGEIKLAVTAKAVGLDWHGHENLVYSAAPVNVTATATGLETGDSCTVTVTNGTETNAGAHTAKATAVSNGNYVLPTAVTQSYTIAKAPVTFAVTANEHDYDATAKTATVAQTAGETPAVAGKFTVSYAKDNSPVATPTNAGVYDVLVTLDDTNFKHKGSEDDVREIKVGTLTINGVKYPQADTMTWPTAANITYGQTLSDSTLTGGDQTASGGYAWKDGNTVPTVTNSGYTVVFTPNDGNYAPVEHTVSITVAKATPALTLPTAAGVTYGETLADSTLSGGSAKATYNGADRTVPGRYTWTTSAAMPAVSDSDTTEYGLTFTPTDTANYNVVTSGKAKLAVAQKPVGLTWAGHTALVYNGSAVNVTATATGLVSGDSCTVTVTDGGKTDAGNYTAKATAVSNPNYKLPNNPEQAYTIDKKPVKVLWSDLFPTYSGTAKSPTVALEGVVNGEDCTVLSTGSAAAGNAGRYKVAAALQGTRSSNYMMQNPGEMLVIQPAQVSISLSDYSHKYDGAAKYATVTATPDVPLTITYRLAGNTVAAPTEEGIYDIIVELNGKNYRFAEGTDGKTRRMGALTIYKEKPPELYTITFAPGAEDAAGTAPTLPAAVKDTVHFLPSNSFLRAGHAFVGWKNGETLYQPGERFIQPANNSTVFTAQWEAATYDIGGVVDQDGKPVANVRVILMRGAEQVAETVTNQIGEYHFDSVLPGLYNLVASKPSPDGVGDIIMTIMAEVKAADVEQANITLPSGKTNSIVEVAPGTPKIIVGNLDKTFKNTEGSDYTPEDKEVVNKGGTVEIKFIAEEKQKSEITGDAEEITKEAGGSKIGLYLSLDVEKTVTQPADPSTPDVEPPSDTTPVPETSVLLESVIPLPSDLQGKQSYTVYRVHESTVDSLTTGADSGERIEVSEDKTTLTLYAQKFSTYAIAYTEKSGGGGGDDDDGGGSGSGGSDWKPKPDPIKPKQPAPVAPVVPAPGTDVPGTIPNPTQPDATQPGSPEADGADKEKTGEDTTQKPDGGNNETQKDEIRDALEDAINNLPDTLTDEQRQEYIDRLTEIADAAIAALDGTSDPDEARRIAEQAQEDIAKIVAEALALASGTAKKPFVLTSALLALAAALLAVFALLKRRDKKRKLFSAIFAALAVATFLLTSGWSGFVLADWWTLVVAAFAIGAAMGLLARYSKQEEQPQTK